MNTKTKEKNSRAEKLFQMPPGYDWITGFQGGGQIAPQRQLPEHKGIKLKKK